MSSEEKTAKALVDPLINVKTRLAALWASMMFCYVYGDILSLYKPGVIQDILGEELR